MEKIVDVGPAMGLYWAHPDELREQDVNPQVMPPTMFGQLVSNVSKRGILESVPFCCIPAGNDIVEIVSGHKRIRAAREAGLERIVILLDTSGLSRSAVAAKVIAHNNLSGYSDKQVMAELAQEIQEIEDRLEAYLPPDIDDLELEPMDPLLSPKVNFDWKTVSFTFLPHQLEDMKELIDAMPNRQDLVVVAEVSLFAEFAEALSRYSRFREVKSANHAVAFMAKSALDIVESGESQLSDGEWLHLTEVLGTARVPRPLGEELAHKMKSLKSEGQITHGWQLLETILAAYEE